MKTSQPGTGQNSQIGTPAHRVHGLSQLELDFRQQSLSNLKPAAPAAPAELVRPGVAAVATWFSSEIGWFRFEIGCDFHGPHPQGWDFRAQSWDFRDGIWERAL